MSRKLLFFDIDGTLFDGQKVTESAVRAIERARQLGHLAFVNTGRTLISVDERIRKLGFDGYVCGCGNYISFQDKVLFSNCVSGQQSREILKVMRQCEIPAAYEADGAVYFDAAPGQEDERIEAVRRFCGNTGKTVPRDLAELPEEFSFVKFLCFYQENSRRIEAEAYLEKQFTCINSGRDIKEVVPKQYSKGSGIRFLCEYLNADISDCFAFGDSENDIEMFRAVPNAIAMGNCAPGLLPYSTWQTAAIQEDGISKALEHFQLN